jgi:predicted membrane channel-forming protein YqfA (hemolysin III family)
LVEELLASVRLDHSAGHGGERGTDQLVAFGVFGPGMAVLYTASTIYHVLMRAYSVDPRKKIVDVIQRGRAKAEVGCIFGVGISLVKR